MGNTNLVSDLDESAIDEAVGLKMISIRLPMGLIEDFKLLSQYEHRPYQALMRDALRIHAEAAKTSIIQSIIDERSNS